MLRGSYSAKIDAKGRLKIPNAFRGLVEGQNRGTAVYVTSLTGDSVRLYPMSVWAGVEERLSRMPSTHPARLRDGAGMTGDVDVLGLVDYLDVWNHERFLSKLQREPFSDDDARALAEHGI